MIHALYLHIPFCHKICPFCSFAVCRDNPAKHAAYFELVKKEFDLLPPLDLSRIESIYFGGGTPSRLPLKTLTDWVEWLRKTVGVGVQTQWSIEANPEDLSPDYANGLARLGFKRISLGVQSFQGQGLESLRRQHTPEDSRQAVANIHQAGIQDLNLDLMFGYPDQGIEDLEADLAAFKECHPTHISAYCLNIEQRTPLFRQPQWQQWQDANEALIAEMYQRIVTFLARQGYRQYEISNFALDGYQSLQNLVNWGGQDYLGLGMGAHSLVSSQRWGNHRRWVDYRKALQSDHLPRQYQETLDLTQKRDERLMLTLRQTKGLDLSEFESCFDVNVSAVWGSKLDQLKTAGLVKLDQQRMQLTLPGMLLADEITAVLAAMLANL
ncbi:radical SAM family heme chaperone HemW [bacterium]|nr:radical SAM family heme chaperone HemW [bacterium]